MLLSNTLRLVGLTLGSALYLFLTVLVARKRGAGRLDRLVLAGLSAATCWQICQQVGLFHQVTAGVVHETLLRVLGIGATISGALAAPLAVAVAAAFFRSAREAAPAFAVSLAVAAAGLLAGPQSAVAAFGLLAPALCLTYFIYRYNFLGLLISRRLVFALTLGVIFAVYLVAVRRAAGFLEDAFEAVGPLVELALLFAAALVWLPLYGWMTRFFTQRTQLYADFSKRVIEEAARILDLGLRLQFLAEGVARSFGLPRVLLITVPEGLRGEFGPRQQNEPPAALRRLARDESLGSGEIFHVEHSPPQVHTSLAELGFNYLFPLRYEDRLSGLLLLDTAPRRFLDENEPILLGLSRQISHSIETCRVIEGKIGLERALVKQEHLASLGKVAATIAHEIKNPLSSIKTLAQLMREDPQLAQRYAKDLTYMIGETDRLNRSVLQLLSFSRPAPETEEEVNLSELLESAVGVLARDQAPERIWVEPRIEPDLKLKRASPELIKQVVLNLALNAIQASEPDSTVRVEAARQPDGSVAIRVSDQGPGIPAEIREKIFEPFFTTRQKGTGLGLAIVRKNVRHLNGDIRIESPVEGGRGTAVTVTLAAQ